MDTNKSFAHSVRVNWNPQTVPTWNECCAMVVDVFGLPGDRFMFRPKTDHMLFEFVSEKDALMCKIMFSDRL